MLPKLPLEPPSCLKDWMSDTRPASAADILAIFVHDGHARQKTSIFAFGCWYSAPNDNVLSDCSVVYISPRCRFKTDNRTQARVIDLYAGTLDDSEVLRARAAL